MEPNSSTWPEGKAPATLDEFHQCMQASRILQVEESWRVIEGLPEGKRPQAPKALASELVKAGLLTRFQAQGLLQGKIKYLAFGEYVILEKLGQGGMGQVLKAEHRRMKRTVALKVISGAAMKNADAIRRFQREVHAAARLIHPNIVTAFDANEHAGIHFFVMEYVAGKDLNAVIKDQGPLPVGTALEYVLQVARGLAYAHGKGIVHRDIKPGNLLVDGEGTVKILDMGLARVDQGAADGNELTNTGQVMGTVDYMAPEQAEDTHAADARADIYSLGCTLYRLLTGNVLYGGDTVMKKLLAHRTAPIPALAIVRPDVPAAVEAVFKKMVAKDPQDRQQSMTQVVTELENCLRGDAGAKAVAAAPEPTIDLKLAEFLSGVSKKSGTGVAAKKETKVAAPADVTQDLSAGDTSPTVIRSSAANAVETRMPSTAAPPAAKKRKPLTAWLTRHPAVVLIATALGGLALAAAGIVIFLPAGDSTIRVELNDPSIEVTVSGSGYKIKGKSEEIHVKPGEHTLHVKTGELEFDTQKFVLGKGENPPLKVELLPGIVQVVSSDGKRLAERSRPKAAAASKSSPQQQNSKLAEIAQLEKRLSDAPNTFDYATHNSLRHLYSEIGDDEKCHHHSDVILRNKLMDPYIVKTYLGGGDDTVAAARRVAPVLQKYPQFKYLTSACWIGLGDLAATQKDTQAAKDYFSRVAGIAGQEPELERYRALVARRIAELGASGAAAGSPESASVRGAAPSSDTRNFALSFDGQDDYVEIPSLKYDGSHPLTIEAWVRPYQAVNAAVMQIFGPTAWMSLAGGGNGSWGTLVTAGNQHLMGFRGQPSQPGQSTHLAAVWDKKDLRLYINGRLGVSARAITSNEHGGITTIGAGYSGGETGGALGVRMFYFAGEIDEVRVSKVARYDKDFTPTSRCAPDEQTLALYHFDEGQGDVLTDSSVNGHHGKIVGPKWVPGIAGAPITPLPPTSGFALEFNGKDSYVDLPLRYDGSHPITLEATIVPYAVYDEATVIGDTDGTGVTLNFPGRSNTGLGVLKASYVQGSYREVNSREPIVSHRQIHVAGVIDGSQIRLFINGQLQGSAEVGGAYKPGPYPFLIGANPPINPAEQQMPFPGIIDEVRVSKVARYEKDFTPPTRFEPDNDTLALYHFDEGSGETLNDSSGNNHHGKIVNAKWVPGVALGPPDRRAAEAVLALGGTATIRIAGSEQAIKQGGTLPADDFELIRVHIEDQPQATDAAIVSLADAKNLIDVFLQNVPIGDATLQRLAKLPKLEILNVPQTKITDAGVAHLKAHATLKALSIDSTPITDAALAALADVPNLEMLWAAGTQITGAGLVHLKNLTHMKFLNIANTRINDASLAHLAGLTEMKRLVVAENPHTDAALEHLINFKQFEELDAGNTRLTDAGLAALATKGPKSIRRLFISGTRVTDAGLAHLKALPQLRKLRLGWTSVTDAGLVHLKELRNLNELQLSGTKATAAGVEELRKSLPRCQISADAAGAAGTAVTP